MLTKQDCDCLIESIESWIDKDMGGNLMEGLFMGLATRNDPQAEAAFKKESAERRAKSDAARKNRKERAIVIQAKLLAMRDSMTASDLVEDAIRG